MTHGTVPTSAWNKPEILIPSGISLLVAAVTFSLTYWQISSFQESEKQRLSELRNSADVKTEQRLTKLEAGISEIERKPTDDKIADLQQRVANIEGRIDALLGLIKDMIPRGRRASVQVPTKGVADWIENGLAGDQLEITSKPLKREGFREKEDLPESFELMIKKK